MTLSPTETASTASLTATVPAYSWPITRGMGIHSYLRSCTRARHSRRAGAVDVYQYLVVIRLGSLAFLYPTAFGPVCTIAFVVRGLANRSAGRLVKILASTADGNRRATWSSERF